MEPLSLGVLGLMARSSSAVALSPKVAMRTLASTTAIAGARMTFQIDWPDALITVSSCRTCRSSTPTTVPISTVTERVRMVHRAAVVASDRTASCGPPMLVR